MNNQPQGQQALTRKERKDLNTLALFTSVYCAAHHRVERAPLESLPYDLERLKRYLCCSECREFLLYAIDRRLHCPFVDNPSCKHCQLHCFRDGHREKVREIMRFSGPALIRKGRLDLLWHYLF